MACRVALPCVVFAEFSEDHGDFPLWGVGAVDTRPVVPTFCPVLSRAMRMAFEAHPTPESRSARSVHRGCAFIQAEADGAPFAVGIARFDLFDPTARGKVRPATLLVLHAEAAALLAVWPRLCDAVLLPFVGRCLAAADRAPSDGLKRDLKTHIAQGWDGEGGAAAHEAEIARMCRAVLGGLPARAVHSCPGLPTAELGVLVHCARLKSAGLTQAVLSGSGEVRAALAAFFPPLFAARLRGFRPSWSADGGGSLFADDLLASLRTYGMARRAASLFLSQAVAQAALLWTSVAEQYAVARAAKAGAEERGCIAALHRRVFRKAALGELRQLRPFFAAPRQSLLKDGDLHFVQILAGDP